MTSVSDSSVVENQESGIYETPLSALELMAVQMKILADTTPDEGVKAKSQAMNPAFSFLPQKYFPAMITSPSHSRLT